MVDSRVVVMVDVLAFVVLVVVLIIVLVVLIVVRCGVVRVFVVAV